MASAPVLAGLMAHVAGDEFQALRVRAKWDLKANNGDKSFSLKGKIGIDYENKAKKALKARGIVVSGSRDGSVILTCAAPAIIFIAFGVALQQRDPDLIDALKTKDTPANLQVFNNLLLSSALCSFFC